MNSTHAAAAGGGTAFGSALAVVLAHSFGLDPTLAAAWVTVIAGIGTGAGSLFVWWWQARHPGQEPPPIAPHEEHA